MGWGVEMAFVGRTAELAALVAHAEATIAAGRLRVVLILAAPGAGASGLVDEFLRRADTRVVRATAPRRPGGPPLRTWHRFLDELGEPGEPAAEETIWAMERRLVAALAGAVATSGPLVGFLDDLHRADDATMGLLAELADRAPAVPVLLIAVVRPDDDADLPTGPAVHRLWLRGLDTDEVAELLTELVGHPIPAQLAHQLWRRTDGAPAVLSAIAGQVRPGDDGRRRVTLRWPDALAAETAARLAGLSVAAHRALGIAAVVGREFDLSIVEPVIGDGALVALDEAVEAGLLRVLPEQVFAFTTALTREICYDSLGLATAAAIHEAVADSLIGLGARVGERAPTVGELTHHLVQATVLGGAERLDRAIAAAVASAQAAASAEDFEEAIAGYAVACDLAARAQWQPGLLGRLYVALGSAHLALAARSTGDVVDTYRTAGREALAAAARQARHSGDSMLLAAAALGYGSRPGRDATAAPPDPDRRSALMEALAALNGDGGADLSTVARLRARLAIELAPSGEAVRLAADALSAARECADPRAMAEALLASGGVGLAEHRQAIREAGVLGERGLLARAHQSAAALLLGVGEVAAADRQLAVVAGLSGVAWSAGLAAAHRSLLAGRVGEAADQAAGAREAGAWAGSGAADLAYAAQLAAIALVVGVPGEVSAALSRIAAPQPWWVSAAAAWTAAAEGQSELASALMDEVLGAPEGIDSWTALLLSEAVLLVGEPGPVPVLLAALGSAESGGAGRAGGSVDAKAWVVVGPAVASAGPVALAQARLLTASGDLPEAARQLEIAGRGVGSTPWLPWLRLARARWLLARNASGDGEAAAKELKAARVGAADRGLVGLVARIDTVVPSETGSLTRRERDVLELAVAGASAKEIAERLVIGERTVETHLANIYRKFGVRNRVELITRISEGLPSSGGT
ncbi:DNA-binding CsgD family transcriptional regulator/nitroreductase [Allocatelliglobosispora scoriae]|uniref:DNA-binding CsgD family transcriptional regulator/nitroreductase n=1 Tax=Allocatelliglobosispora scoriae TaxID=643052 RepID=A0A841BWY5_9ACTN|nr:LuxR family transcriptional regulator [Allocatelliglobosispora scoriae]MBB5871423.1 DNA-binding CsgD family transcriptional regulator/nitroreductase [Allocatelliglobosispora scoriae]